MEFAGPIISIFFIAAVAWLLVKKLPSVPVLFLAGLSMLFIAPFLSGNAMKPEKPTGLAILDIFKMVAESMVEINSGVGLVIMVICGFLAYMDKIGASNSLIRLAMVPLAFFKKYPYMLATLVMPFGQFLFISITSAAGLGLLLMATMYPIMVNLGVSRLSAASLIMSTTAFGIGPASAIAMSASSVLKMDVTQFFFQYQVPMVTVVASVLFVSFLVVNKILDKNLPKEEVSFEKPGLNLTESPLIYGILPLIPLVMLLVFSDFMGIAPGICKIDTNVAMLSGTVIAIAIEFIRRKPGKEILKDLESFWSGMTENFASVILLIVAADIFAKGLISLGFISGLTSTCMHFGLGGAGIGVVMSIMIFLASILMGSGNAAFFAFGPLVPEIAASLSYDSVKIILPMAFAASMGRTVSPIAGILVAIAGIAKVSPMDIVKRNLIPLCLGLLVMLCINFLF